MAGALSSKPGLSPEMHGLLFMFAWGFILGCSLGFVLGYWLL